MKTQTTTVTPAAARVGLSRAMVHRKAKAGHIPGAYRDEYGYWRIPVDWKYTPLKRGRKRKPARARATV